VDLFKATLHAGAERLFAGDGSRTPASVSEPCLTVVGVEPLTPDIGKILLVTGVAITLVGGLVMLIRRLPFGIPGDISGSRGGFSFAIPIGTSILVSIVLTVLLNIFLHLRH